MFKTKRNVIVNILVICTFLLIFAILQKAATFDNQLKNNYVFDLKNTYNELSDFFGKMSEKERSDIFGIIDKSCDFNSNNNICTSFYTRLKQQGINFYVTPLENHETLYLNQQVPKLLCAQSLLQKAATGLTYNGKALIFDKGYMIINYHFYKKSRLDRESEKIYRAHAYNYIGLFDVDTNGKKGPNVYGRDIFRFLLLDDGTLYPYMGANGIKNCRKYKIDANNMADNTGISCAARIMKDGWKMKY